MWKIWRNYVKNMKEYVKNTEKYVDILDLALSYLYEPWVSEQFHAWASSWALGLRKILSSASIQVLRFEKMLSFPLNSWRHPDRRQKIYRERWRPGEFVCFNRQFRTTSLENTIFEKVFFQGIYQSLILEFQDFSGDEEKSSRLLFQEAQLSGDPQRICIQIIWMSVVRNSFSYYI